MAGSVAQQSVLVGITGAFDPASIAQVSILVSMQLGTPEPIQPTHGFFKPPDPVIPNAAALCLHRIRMASRRVEFPPKMCDRTDFEEYHLRGSMVTPAPAAGEVLVLDTVMPYTYAGLIHGICLHYTGTGFVEGSGDIVWRVRVGNGWAHGMGNVKTQLGEPAQFLQLTDHIAIPPGQRIRISVSVPNLSGLIQVGTSRVLVGVQGWVFSMRPEDLAVKLSSLDSGPGPGTEGQMAASMWDRLKGRRPRKRKVGAWQS